MTKPEHTATKASKPTAAKASKAKKPASPRKPTAAKPTKTKASPKPTNGERIAKLAERENGFALHDITEMLGIQPHTARALISIELRKKRGLNVVINKETKRYRVIV